MKPSTRIAMAAAPLLAACFISSASAQVTGGAPAVSHVRRAPPFSTLAGFVENRGQWAPEVLFFARTGGVEATLLRDALVFRSLRGAAVGDAPPPPLVLRLPGSANDRAVDGIGELPTLHHFFLASGCASNVRGFETVVYRDTVPGIDLVVRIEGEVFEYDVLVDAGADLDDFVVEVDGADRLDAVGANVLALETPAGVVEQTISASWQEDDATGEREPIASGFRVLESSGEQLRFGFAAPDRDPGRVLVIDPSLVYATYIGGSTLDFLVQMAVDGAGAVYLVAKSFGGTPVTSGSFQTTFHWPTDTWIGKLSSDGTALEWGTYLGGTDPEEPAGIAVAADGAVVVAGHTWSRDFPTTPGTVQPVFSGVATKSDLFVTRLHPTGSSLVWSTFYGGPDYETADALALLPSGDVVIAADPYNGGMPATPGVFDAVFDVHDQMLIRLSADGSSLVFHTYFKCTRVLDIAIDSASNICFVGDSYGTLTPVPTTPGAFKEVSPPGPATEGFVAKLNAEGTQLRWATYLGGDEGYDTVWGIAVDEADAVYVAGQTDSDDFPVTTGSFDATMSGDDDGFVAKILPGGSDLVWSTYLGSCCGGGGASWDLGVDAAGNAHVVGSYNEPSFPTTQGAFQVFYIGPFPHGDSTLTKFDAFGEKLVYSTWFGANGTDYLPHVDLDGTGHPHIALVSYSADIPVTPGAYQSSSGGGGDMVVAEFDLPLLSWRMLGDGLAGGVDTPNLAGAGTLTPGSPTRLKVRGAAPSSLAWFVAGVTKLDLPLLGGTLVPFPDAFFALSTDAGGAINVSASWPSLPPGTAVTFQVWILDAGAPQLWSATNAVETVRIGL